MMKKTCTKCLKEFDATSINFHRATKGKYGLTAVCKECTRIYYLSNNGLDRIRKYDNKKYCRSCGVYKLKTEFHWSNRANKWHKSDCKNCRVVAWAQDHPDTYTHWTPEYRRDRHLDNRKSWYRKHVGLYPEKFRSYASIRRARVMNAEGTYTVREWLDKLVDSGYKCFYCSTSLSIKTATKDHIIALSRGGSNWITNITPACHSCNSGKCDRDQSEYKQFKQRQQTERRLQPHA